MDLLPAIDLRQGTVVRLLHGEDSQRTEYSADPEGTLEALAAAGTRWVHVVDLDAAFGEAPQLAWLEKLSRRAEALGLQLEWGGGLRDEAAVGSALDAGASRVVLGSLAITQPGRFDALARSFPGRLVPAVETREGEVRVKGWREVAAGTLSELCSPLVGLPCPAVLVTDVGRDGALSGPNFELTRQVAAATGLPALLSGGVATLDHLREARRFSEIAGVIVGRALYEGRFSVADALREVEG